MKSHLYENFNTLFFHPPPYVLPLHLFIVSMCLTVCLLTTFFSNKKIKFLFIIHNILPKRDIFSFHIPYGRMKNLPYIVIEFNLVILIT